MKVKYGNMCLFGIKDIFAIELNKDKFAYQMSLFVKQKDILRFEIKGVQYPYRWSDFNDIVEWFEENLEHVLQNDKFPLKIDGNSAAELCKNSFDKDFDDIEKYEILQEWIFRHSWFSAREGSYLADVYFRNVNDNIEISWNNVNTFKKDGVKYIFQEGCYYIDIELFKTTIIKFIQYYKQL